MITWNESPGTANIGKWLDDGRTDDQTDWPVEYNLLHIRITLFIYQEWRPNVYISYKSLDLFPLGCSCGGGDRFNLTPSIHLPAMMRTRCNMQSILHCIAIKKSRRDNLPSSEFIQCTISDYMVLLRYIDSCIVEMKRSNIVPVQQPLAEHCSWFLHSVIEQCGVH